MTLDQESIEATKLLKGKVVKKVVRHNPKEMLLEFEDGSRLFIDSATEIECSITD